MSGRFEYFEGWSRSFPTEEGKYLLTNDDGYSSDEVEVFRKGRRLLLKHPKTGRTANVRGFEGWAWKLVTK